MNDYDLWPLAMQHAAWIHNHTPHPDEGLSPEELWTGTKSSHSTLLHAHTWGCPVYVLDPRLQNGQKIPKWEPRARRGRYLGASPLHASTVGLILNPRTGNISPQFHAVYDDYFETVHSSEDEEPQSWPELVTFQTFRNDIDDEDYVPLLADEWLNDAEVADRHRAELERRGGAPVDQVLPPDPHRTTPTPDNVNNETLEEHEMPTANGNKRHEEVKGEPSPRDPPDQLPASPDLHRSVRNHRTPTRFTFNHQHGYMAVKALKNVIMKQMIGSQCELKYIYTLCFDQNFGLLDNLMPHVLGQCPHLMKASASDPDTPTRSEAMSGPHRDEFVAAMKAEIEELEFHETWNVLPRTLVPKGANILPGTWSFKESSILRQRPPPS